MPASLCEDDFQKQQPRACSCHVPPFGMGHAFPQQRNDGREKVGEISYT